MDQLLATLAATHPNVRFLRVEAEEVDELAERFDVSAVPFFTFHAKGALVDRLEGADAAALAEKPSTPGSASAARAPSAPRPPPPTAVRRRGPRRASQARSSPARPSCSS